MARNQPLVLALFALLVAIVANAAPASTYSNYGSGGNAAIDSFTFQLPQANRNELASTLTATGRSYGSGAATNVAPSTAKSAGNSYSTAITRDSDAIVYPDDLIRDSYGNIAKPYAPLDDGTIAAAGGATASSAGIGFHTDVNREASHHSQDAAGVQFALPSYASGILAPNSPSAAAAQTPHLDLLPPAPQSSGNFNYPSIAGVQQTPDKQTTYGSNLPAKTATSTTTALPPVSLNEVPGSSDTAQRYPTLTAVKPVAVAASADGSSSTYTHGKFTGSFGGAPGFLGEQKIRGTALKPAADDAPSAHSGADQPQQAVNLPSVASAAQSGAYNQQQADHQASPVPSVASAAQSGSYNQQQASPLPSDASAAQSGSYNQQHASPLPSVASAAQSGSYNQQQASPVPSINSAAQSGSYNQQQTVHQALPSTANSGAYNPQLAVHQPSHLSNIAPLAPSGQYSPATTTAQQYDSGHYQPPSAYPTGQYQPTTIISTTSTTHRPIQAAAGNQQHQYSGASSTAAVAGSNGNNQHYGSSQTIQPKPSKPVFTLESILGEQKQPGYGVVPAGASVGSSPATVQHSYQPTPVAPPAAGSTGKYTGGFGGPPGVLNPYDRPVHVGAAAATAEAPATAGTTGAAYAGPNKRY